MSSGRGTGWAHRGNPFPGSGTIAGSGPTRHCRPVELKDLGLNVKIVDLSFQQFNQGNMSTVGSDPGMDFSYAGQVRSIVHSRA